MREMNELAKAYAAWKLTPVRFNGDCCIGSHFALGDDGELNPKMDEDVCVRERAWRKCVRLRDDNFKFPLKDGTFLQ